MTLVYFVGISHIGYLLFHFYSILAIIFGFLSYDVIIKMIANRYKKWYNFYGGILWERRLQKKQRCGYLF